MNPTQSTEPVAADGTLPCNNYLWPTESWWLGHENRKFDGRWHFGYVALADGRFSVEGSTFAINRNEINGLPCVFNTREQAIRVSAARMIRVMRASRHWNDPGGAYGGMTGHELAEAINWTLATVARETDASVVRTVSIPDPEPASANPVSDLPLFSFTSTHPTK